MKRILLLLLSICVVFFVTMVILPGCAVKKDNSDYMKKKYKADVQSHVNTTMLGRNKYFYSTKYQKKLFKYKKK
jgi:hypothetical protein